MRKQSLTVSLIIVLVGSTLAATWPEIAQASKFQPPSIEKLGIGTTFGRWPDGVVPWVYNSGGAPAPFTNDEAYFVAQFEEAIAELEGVSGLTFDYQGIDNAAGFDTDDGIVVVGWDALAGAAGQAGPRFGACTGQDVIDLGYCPYTDGFVKFDNDGSTNWDKGVADFTERGFQQVAVHELLHLVGIGHSEVAQSIMFANPYTNLSHPREDDISGLTSLYGEPDALSPAPVYMPPGAGMSLFTESFIATDLDDDTEITEIDGTEQADFGVWHFRVNGPYDEDVTVLATDPDGFFYQGRVDNISCNPGFQCFGWRSFAQMETLFTFPGVWTVYVIVNGALLETESVTVTTNELVLDQAPDSTFKSDLIYGPAPLTVKMTLDVTGDNEGDAVDATWHIPTVGQIPLDSGNFPGSAGTSIQTVTFDKPGEYEIYTEVNDDWARYQGAPGDGDEAGDGFRTLYRTVVRVTKVADDITTFQDVNADNVPDLAAFTGGNNSKPQINVFSGADKSVISNIKYLTSAKWRGLALGTVRDGNQNGNANDPAVALLAEHEVSGKIMVETRRLDTGASLGKMAFRNADWRAIDVVIIDDLNGDGVTDDTAIAVLAQHRTNGKITLQIKRLGTGTLVRNITVLTNKWTPYAAAVVDRSMMGNLSPLIGVLAEHVSNGKRRVQSRLVSNGNLDRNVDFFNAGTRVKDVTAMHDANSDGAMTDPAWQVLGIRNSDKLVRVQTRLASNGSLESSKQILNAKWEGFRLESTMTMNANLSHELAVAMQKRATGKRRVHIKDFDTNAQIINISP